MEAAAVPKPRVRRRDLLEDRRFLGPALIAPAVLFILLLVGLPLLLAVWLSFTDATSGSLPGNWVGLQNFSREWHNEIFRRALWNTFIFTVISTIIVLLGAGVRANRARRDRLAVDLRLAVQRRELDARAHAHDRDRLRPLPCPQLLGLQSAAVARRPDAGEGVDHHRARVADPPVRDGDLHRGDRVHPERGARRGRGRRRDRAQEVLVR